VIEPSSYAKDENSDISTADSYAWVSSYNAYYATFGWGIGIKQRDGNETEELVERDPVEVNVGGSRLKGFVGKIWKA
jgi:hypothetical protein